MKETPNKENLSINITRIATPTEEDKRTFKVSSHLDTQLGKYNYPPDNTRQLSLFDTLKEETKEKVEALKIETSRLVQGIKLKPKTENFVNFLCRKLHETSQIFDPEKEDYYTGDTTPLIANYALDKEKKAYPRLTYNLRSLTLEYVEYIGGSREIGGKDTREVETMIKELSSKPFLISYVRNTFLENGKRIEDIVEDIAYLVKILPIKRTFYNEKGEEERRIVGEALVLNHIFIDQIDSNFILYPKDIEKRTAIAYGAPKVSEATLNLRRYLLKKLKYYNNEPTPRIEEDRLFYLVSEKQMRESRKKLVKENTYKALDTMINLGLLLSYKVEKSKKTGEPLIVFFLNKEFIEKEPKEEVKKKRKAKK